MCAFTTTSLTVTGNLAIHVGMSTLTGVLYLKVWMAACGRQKLILENLTKLPSKIILFISGHAVRDQQLKVPHRGQVCTDISVQTSSKSCLRVNC